MRLTDKQYKNLLKSPNNTWLNKKPEEKYAKFATKDPFPEINEALLNANDVVKYIATVGIIHPFIPGQLSGVTYTANFSGNIYYYEPEGKQIYKSLSDNESFTLESNSVYFLEIDSYFRVPDYMVLRYNLRVKNVYKGLLLGTGPIIDSGFQGKLFIPLHNLTSNSYIIKKGAKLIDIEFTKLSLRPDWEIKTESKLLKIIQNLDFSTLPLINNDFIGENADRPFEIYIKKSLIGDSDFLKKGDGLFVNSSVRGLEDKLYEDIETNKNQLSSTINDSVEKSEKALKEANDLLNKSEQRENFVKTFSVLAVLGLLLTAITLMVAAFDYFYQASELKLSYQYLEQSIEYNEQRIKDIILLVDILGNDEDLSDELTEQYREILSQISEEIDELEKQREQTKNSQALNTAFIITLGVISLFALGLAIFSTVKIATGQKVKEKHEKSK